MLIFPKDCLRDPKFYFKDLVSSEALEPPKDISMPFGVFLKGKFRSGETQDPEKLVLVVRIPYLGPEQISLSEPSESWSLSGFTSQVVAEHMDNPLMDDALPVHQAIFVVLNNGL